MKTKHYLFALLAQFFSMTALAYDVEIDGIYYNFNGTEATVTNGSENSYSGDIVIPQSVTYNGNIYDVTNIGDYAFRECTGLTSIKIPEGVTSIGDDAFYGCSGLTSITIPNGVTSIRGYVFSFCSGLTSITIPNSVTSIGYCAFYGCSSLTSITIPNSVTSIGQYAFSQCDALTSINVEEGNTKYDSRENCNAIIETSSNTLIAGCKSSTIPNSVTSIGDEAFYVCRGLTSITIPNNVTSIGYSAFSFCSGLTSITIPNSVTSIGDCAFYNCSSLTSITIPEGMTSIENSTFYECSGLTSITIPNSVTSIGDCAFYNCSSLTSITIPNSVMTIGYKAFYECSGLTSITIPNSVTSIGKDAFEETTWYNNQPDGLIYVGESAYKYKGTMPENTSIDIKDGTVSISPAAFSSCYNLTSITIPNSVTSIGDQAFENCSGLTSAIIPHGVTSIGSGAFSFCRGLTSITIPNIVTNIVHNAFYACSGLTSIVVEEGNANYDSRDNCNAIIETSSSTLIAGCQNTMIPNNVTSIGEAAFYGCSGLSSITIPNSVTSIGDMAFYNCNGLTSITIPGSVKRIRYYTFWACRSLTSVTISNGVTTIELGAFDLCERLTSVTIPASVTSIEEHAFSRCYRLTDIYCYAKNVPTTNTDAFSSVFGSAPISSATLHVPANSIDAYKTTAPWSDFKEIVVCNEVDAEDSIIVAVDNSTTMEIDVNNYDMNLVSFQMDITLPEGIGIDKTRCALSSRITDEEQELIIGKLESGVYRLTSTSLSLTPISGNDGTLLTLKLTAAKDCAGGQATINNIIFSTSESEKVIMSDESFDINILYKYNLTYKVDGEVYKTEEVVEAMPLSLEAEPTKDGYTFGGWSELPEIMPNHDVEVIGRFYLYGDVNTDEEVDVVDVVDIARFVVATPSASFREKLADLNYDNTVNIADAVTLVNHIAGDQNFVKAEKQISGSVDYTQCQLQLQSSGQKALSLSLAGGADFTAFQFEVDVPENTDITAMRINGLRKDGHQLLYNKVSENRYRVAALSLSNATFLGSEGELLNISIDGLATDDVCIHDIHFVKANGTDVTFDTLYLSGHVTNIADVDGTESGSIYDLQGRHRSTLQRGLNIVGNKTIIKK